MSLRVVGCLVFEERWLYFVVARCLLLAMYCCWLLVLLQVAPSCLYLSCAFGYYHCVCCCCGWLLVGCRCWLFVVGFWLLVVVVVAVCVVGCFVACCCGVRSVLCLFCVVVVCWFVGVVVRCLSFAGRCLLMCVVVLVLVGGGGCLLRFVRC